MRVCNQRNWIQRILFFVRWQLWLVVLSLPYHAAFCARGVGDRRTGFWKRTRLAVSVLWIHLRVPCIHAPGELLAIIEEIVTLPPSIRGVIVECGCYQGGSTAKLSIAARIANRELVVCDSFQGLPPPGMSDRVDEKEAFERGDFASRLDEVENNVRHYGDPAVVRYVPGWYQETLDQLAGVDIACVFLDVDLEESVTVCLQKLWNSVAPGCKVFVHDVDRPPVVRPFQNEDWWARQFHSPIPRFVGGGSGLGWQKRLLGYSVKS